MEVLAHIHQVQLSKEDKMIPIFKVQKESLWATKIITASHINYHMFLKTTKQSITFPNENTNVGSSMSLLKEKRSCLYTEKQEEIKLILAFQTNIPEIFKTEMK